MEPTQDPLQVLQQLPTTSPLGEQQIVPKMQSPLVWKIILGIVVLLVMAELLVGGYYLFGRQQGKPQHLAATPVAPQSAQPTATTSAAIPIDTDFWRTPAIASFSAQELQNIQKGILDSIKPDKIIKIVAIGIKGNSSWALITTAPVLIQTNQLTQTSPSIFLAHLESTGTWYVTSPARSDFCTVLQKAQAPLAIDQTSYNYYCSGSTATASATKQ